MIEWEAALLSKHVLMIQHRIGTNTEYLKIDDNYTIVIRISLI